MEEFEQDFGPFYHHVYLACCDLDLEPVIELKRKLESLKLKCTLCIKGSQERGGVISRIETGIKSSRKVVVYVTENYLRDPWSREEVKMMNEKASRFSRDVVIILKENWLTEFNEAIQHTASIVVPREAFRDEGFAKHLSTAIMSDLNPKLTVMPKQNLGYAAAISYFYGFLRIVLPDFQNRLQKETLHPDPEMIRRTVRKLMIIIPESCYCQVKFNDDEGGITHTEKYVVQVANRAGNKNRDYKSSLYKIHDTQEDENYYFVGELATPILTLYEAYDDGVIGMTREQLDTERDVFYETLKALLNHEKYKQCHGQFELLFWRSDPGCENDKPKVKFADFILPIVKRLVGQPQQETMSSRIDSPARAENTESRRETFETVEVHGDIPTALYERALFNEYQMTRNPRGICMVINNHTFTGQRVLRERAGSSIDVALVEKLFLSLRFLVEKFENYDLHDLEKALLEVASRDHSCYDAFVCVCMSHGVLGELYTSDSQLVPISSLVSFFEEKSCPSLRGKPKMFFIQACQNDSEPRPPDTASYQRTSTGAGAVGPTQVDGGTGLVDDDGQVTTEAATIETDACACPSLLMRPRHESKLVPASPDFVMSYATLPGSFSFRDPDNGSLYIVELYNQLCGSKYELNKCLLRVTQGVKKRLKEYDQAEARDQSLTNPADGADNERFQLPFHLTTNDKLIHL